jgi:AcrR family transcriptional regulator
LDREVIVTAAIELSASGKAITFRSLGTALGTDPTAVYRHFRDREELMRAVLDRLITMAQARIDRKAPWRDQLRQGAEVIIDVLAAHPWAGVEATTIATGGPGELGAIDWILTQLERAGLDKRQAVRFYAAYSSFVLGAAAALSRHRLSGEGEARAAWIGEVRAVEVARLPALAAVLPELLALSDRDVFLTGVDILLDSVVAGDPGATG